MTEQYVQLFLPARRDGFGVVRPTPEPSLALALPPEAPPAKWLPSHSRSGRPVVDWAGLRRGTIFGMPAPASLAVGHTAWVVIGGRGTPHSICLHPVQAEDTLISMRDDLAEVLEIVVSPRLIYSA